MKTQSNKSKLDFRKNSVTELTDAETFSINGGTGYVCSNCMTVTEKSITATIINQLN